MPENVAKPTLHAVTPAQADEPIANLEAEEAVLGAMMLAPAAIDAVRAVLGGVGDVFYRPSHQRIYRAAVDLHRDGQPVDVLTIAAELERRGELATIAPKDQSGKARLQEIAALVPAASNAAHYARLVRDAAQRRKLASVGKRLIAAAQDGGIDAHEDLRPLLRSVLEARTSTGLKGLDLAEMLSQPVPPIEWLCDSLIEAGTLNLIVADGYVGKSLLSLDLLMAVRTGAPFLGFKTRRARCGYVDLENHDREIHRRLIKLGLTASDIDGLWISKDRLNLAKPEGAARLRATIEENQLDVIVIDSFRRAAPGVDENDSGAISEFFDPLLEMRDELGVTLIVLHHVRKSNDNRPSDASQMIRGSGDFRNAVDGMLFLRAKKDDKHRFTVEQDKQRSGVKIDPFLVYRENREDGGVRHIYEGPAEANALGADEQMLQQIIKTLRGSTESVLSRTELSLKLGVSYGSGTLYRALELGITREKLTKSQEAKNKPAYIGLGPAAFETETDE